jgi:hypothetical protein
MFNGPQPGKRAPYVRLLTGKLGEERRAILLSSEIWSLETHWFPTGTLPCLKQIGECKGCAQHRREAWKGYLQAVDLKSGELAAIELTEDSCKHCPLLYEPLDLRGKLAVITRKGHKRGSVRLTLSDPPDFLRRPQNLPKGFEIWPVLNRLWDLTFTREQWDTIRGLQIDVRDLNLIEKGFADRIETDIPF